ncbi:hypothetical protein IGI04_019872 [Brassica rapa subsp. trilocularis]|uniref:RRM domain-containing protein n=1 Tax=Brassica rapa subsp. trilocularis TaxID=1813537 RepID=A0ABQ7MH34_BRACM|nr:hypothetical protein IGI04_019872 [Brassica rapa subsp. trilocularis]
MEAFIASASFFLPFSNSPSLTLNNPSSSFSPNIKFGTFRKNYISFSSHLVYSSSAVSAPSSSSSTTLSQNTYWMVVLDKPPQGVSSKSDIVDYYVEILAKVLGNSEKDAQMSIYDASFDTHFGFCCHIDEEASRQLARLPGVLSVRPEAGYSSGNKNYGIGNQTGVSLFDHGTVKHWMVRIDKPGVGIVTKAQMVDHCVQLLSKVLWNEKDAQMCLYHVSWKSKFGFCCDLDETCAEELAGVPGVLAVVPDNKFESLNKDYEGDNSTQEDSRESSESPPVKTKKLFITGLSFYTSEKTLRAAFEGFGELVEVKIIMDKISKRSKGYAFIEYTTEEAASVALKEMNGKDKYNSLSDKGSVFLIRSGLQLGGEEAMKGIARIVNSLSRLGGREIISRGSSKLASSSSSLHRSLFISAATQFPTNSRELTSSSRSSSLLPQKWAFLGAPQIKQSFLRVTLPHGAGGQRRTMFIQTQSTPNPSSLMFYPGKPVMEVGSADFPNVRSALGSPLAKSIYSIDGVVRVFFGSDFVTVTKSDDVSWDILKPEIFAAVMDFYSSGQPLFLDSQAAAAKDTAINDDDSETVAMIKELLETRIRPAVQDDGGDIEYCGFDPESGIVKLRMQGACSGCPSSSVTLKSGIENMLMHYVPEVKGVEQEFDGEEEEGTLSGEVRE